MFCSCYKTRLVTMSAGHLRELTASAMGHTGTSGSSVQLVGGHADAKTSTKDRTATVYPGKWRHLVAYKLNVLSEVLGNRCVHGSSPIRRISTCRISIISPSLSLSITPSLTLTLTLTISHIGIRQIEIRRNGRTPCALGKDSYLIQWRRNRPRSQ